MISSERQEHAISTRLVSPSAVSVDPSKANDYNGFAEAYTAADETSLVNAYYERPAMLALAGDVAGRRILDAGCGSGALFAALRDRGAMVSGFDASAGMLELARRRLGGGADLQVADLGSPLPYADDTFDDVAASLVLHYLEDWGAGAGRAATHTQARRSADHVCRPSLCRQPHTLRGRPPVPGCTADHEAATYRAFLANTRRRASKLSPERRTTLAVLGLEWAQEGGA